MLSLSEVVASLREATTQSKDPLFPPRRPERASKFTLRNKIETMTPLHLSR